MNPKQITPSAPLGPKLLLVAYPVSDILIVLTRNNIQCTVGDATAATAQEEDKETPLSIKGKAKVWRYDDALAPYFPKNFQVVKKDVLQVCLHPVQTCAYIPLIYDVAH